MPYKNKLDFKKFYNKNKKRIAHPKTVEKRALMKATWLDIYVSIRILEIRRDKIEYEESRNKLIRELKKAQAYDRIKVWRSLRMDFENIKRLRLAA